MSLQFYFGPSGAGRSRLLYEEIIKAAEQNTKRNYLVIVPDQFTMQTQKDFVMLSDRGGIMNIDVLSFGRLGHRILEETGSENLPVLDDTGKSLVLQKVAANLKDELPVLGSFIHKQGYIHEVKSAISEFKQYGISVSDMDRLIEVTQKKGALNYKLKDLKTLYQGFQDYINGNFITTEETLDVLKNSLPKSKLIRDSVVVFDGFTGFTPIQNRVIQELMRLCGEVIVTIAMGAGEDPYLPEGEQKLFYLGKKTVRDLEKLAKEAQVLRKKDVFILPVGNTVEPSNRSMEPKEIKEELLTAETSGQNVSISEIQEERLQAWRRKLEKKCEVIENPCHRFQNAPALFFLEQSLFRYGEHVFDAPQEEIVLFETVSPADEVHQTGLFIKELVQKKGIAYRDIAVVTGDLQGYAAFVESEFAQMEIPCYIDRTRGIRLNPLTEFIKSGLELYIRDFSYESVFHYLRTGMTDIDRNDVDLLENYVLATGIRGRKRWSSQFTRKTADLGEDEEALRHINEIRERFLGQVEALSASYGESKDPGGVCAKEHVKRLYDFLVQNEVQQKLSEYEKFFHEQGELTLEREYAQIYRLVMELLEQIHDLLGDEKITVKEFSDLLEAGFSEIEVGTIPQNVDRVLVGDMERTRLKQVKILFFMGINDGNIPKQTKKGGIISDTDREFLSGFDLELAPTPRQQMFIQRLYLYLNMTKPSEKLYLSYSKMGNDGKSLRPSYLVDVVRKMFPRIPVQYPQNRPAIDQIVTSAEGVRYLAEGLREYAAGSVDAAKEKEIFTVYASYGSKEDEGFHKLREELVDAAFYRYRDSGLSTAVAKALYGVQLETSVSRLETFAACAYRHFLEYGLSLKEREEFGFEAADLGNVYHGVLQLFADKLADSGFTWLDFPESFAKEAVESALEQYAAEYGNTVLYANPRNEYAIVRMGRILLRTVKTIQIQLQKGRFLPDKYEMSFSFTGDLESVNVALSKEERMRLKGRIDRVDTAEDDECVYVKVVDYKSGERQFDLAALYYGLQLQLVVYMNAAEEIIQKKNPSKNIVPAALLYYHIDDPAVETKGELSDEEINRQILIKLKMNGVVNAKPGIIEMLDNSIQDKSDVIPVEKKKDGSFSARSGVLSEEELRLLSDFVSQKIKNIGHEMLMGNVKINPYERGNENACTYCSYRKVCGFDPALYGFEMRELKNEDKETLFLKMREELDGSEIYRGATEGDRHPE